MRISLSEIGIDETQAKTDNEYVWLWITIGQADKLILVICISTDRSMLVVAEQLLHFI
jgi:transposase-like protein